ncbi:MAG: hypothetical protein AAF525_02160 [Pseudomonadota bacterium]
MLKFLRLPSFLLCLCSVFVYASPAPESDCENLWWSFEHYANQDLRIIEDSGQKLVFTSYRTRRLLYRLTLDRDTGVAEGWYHSPIGSAFSEKKGPKKSLKVEFNGRQIDAIEKHLAYDAFWNPHVEEEKYQSTWRDGPPSMFIINQGRREICMPWSWARHVRLKGTIISIYNQRNWDNFFEIKKIVEEAVNEVVTGEDA